MRGHHTHFAGPAWAHNSQRAGRAETGPYGRGFRIRRGSRHTARVISDYGRDMSLPYGYREAHNSQRAGRSETGPYGRGFRIKCGSRHTARVISDYGRDMSLPYGYKGTQRPESGPV